MNKLILIYLVLLGGTLVAKAQTTRDTIKGAHGNMEINTVFPAGEKNWKIYVAENFRANVVKCQMAVRDTPYTETAVIQFMISKDGSIRHVKCRNSHMVSAALKNEAERLIMGSPAWLPAWQNGRYINGYRKENISITISPLYL